MIAGPLSISLSLCLNLKKKMIIFDVYRKYMFVESGNRIFYYSRSVSKCICTYRFECISKKEFEFVNSLKLILQW